MLHIQYAHPCFYSQEIIGASFCFLQDYQHHESPHLLYTVHLESLHTFYHNSKYQGINYCFIIMYCTPCLFWQPFPDGCIDATTWLKMQQPPGFRVIVSIFSTKYTTCTRLDTTRPASYRGGSCCKSVEIAHFLRVSSFDITHLISS